MLDRVAAGVKAQEGSRQRAWLGEAGVGRTRKELPSGGGLFVCPISGQVCFPRDLFSPLLPTFSKAGLLLFMFKKT